MTKQELKNFITKHKKEILIGTLLFSGSVIGIKRVKQVKSITPSDTFISSVLDAEEVREFISDVLEQDNNNEYGVIIERLKTT